MSIRGTLQDLRGEILQRLTALGVISAALAAYSTLFADDFPIMLFLLLGTTAASLGLLQRRLPQQINSVRYGLLLVSHLCLFGTMRLTGEAWLPFFGVVLVLVSGMTTTYLHWISALSIFAGTTLIYGVTYTHLALGTTLMLTASIMQTSVASLYTALTWYSTMQKRADELLEETRQRRAELSQTVKSLEIAYQNLRRTQQQLAYAQQQANDARRLKERFAANISHELRTPLNLIMGFSEIMVMKPEVYGETPLPPKLNRDLYQIYSSSRHLLALIDDVLDLSQVELSSFALNLEHTDLNAFIDDNADMFRNLFRDDKLKFILDCEPDLPPLDIDRTRIRQVLLNLLSNAARFTEHGSVTLSVYTQEQRVIFAVADTGRGIPADKIGQIFDEFYQVDYSLSRSHGGAGLGLAISKLFVNRHGGFISVVSQEGVGSTFTVSLPILSVSANAPEEGNAAIPDKYILVLERDPLVAALIRRHVLPYKVILVSDQAELETAVEQYKPHLLIDNSRPSMTTTSPMVNIPSIHCSLPSATWMVNQLHVRAYLAKPFTIQQLLEHIRQAGDIQRILIVDDDRGLIQLVRRSLETLPQQYTVYWAYDGQQALDIIREQHPDLILLDLVMPEMDGFAVMETLRTTPETAQVPVILLTATRYIQDEAEQYGGLFLNRPGGLRPADVLRCLRTLIDQVALFAPV